jgi:hypothetical protein
MGPIHLWVLLETITFIETSDKKEVPPAVLTALCGIASVAVHGTTGITAVDMNGNMDVLAWSAAISIFRWIHTRIANFLSGQTQLPFSKPVENWADQRIVVQLISCATELVKSSRKNEICPLYGGLLNHVFLMNFYGAKDTVIPKGEWSPLTYKLFDYILQKCNQRDETVVKEALIALYRLCPTPEWFTYILPPSLGRKTKGVELMTTLHEICPPSDEKGTISEKSSISEKGYKLAMYKPAVYTAINPNPARWPFYPMWSTEILVQADQKTAKAVLLCVPPFCEIDENDTKAFWIMQHSTVPKLVDTRPINDVAGNTAARLKSHREIFQFCQRRLRFINPSGTVPSEPRGPLYHSSHIHHAIILITILSRSHCFRRYPVDPINSRQTK